MVCVLQSDTESAVYNVDEVRVPAHSRAEQSAQRCTATYIMVYEQGMNRTGMSGGVVCQKWVRRLGIRGNNIA